MAKSFKELGISEPLLANITELGYTEPTPVQLGAIPLVLAGHDVIAAAQTGTGKTAAFSLPILTSMLRDRVQRSPGLTRALVLAPTRELAAQIDENIRAYATATGLVSTLIFGGVAMGPQTEQLRHGTDFLVATPGRLLDHIGQGNISLESVEYLILDEADRMLDMGFIRDIRKVMAMIPQNRQTLLFSATFNDDIRALTRDFLKNPKTVEIAANRDCALVEQEAWSVSKQRKRELLRDLIVDNNWDQVLVFTRMKHAANRLAEQLVKDGLTAAAIHGNKSQSARTKALAGFKDRTVRVLVATDIAARGLDIEGLAHVVNYELPEVPEDYVHRIGRTGRAGMNGHAVSLVCADERERLQAIERLVKHRIELKNAIGYDGPPPEDIVRDNAERDAARKRELEKMRAARRKQRETQKKSEPVQVASPKAAKVQVSDNPDDRFEKKIVRKSKQEQPASRSLRAPQKDSTKPRFESKPARKGPDAGRDDAAPKSRQSHRKDSLSQNASRRKDSVAKPVVERESRFETVRSNLPPGFRLSSLRHH